MPKATRAARSALAGACLWAACGGSSPGSLGAAQAGDGRPIAIENVTVISMVREERLTGHTVVIRDGRIALIGLAGRVDVPKDARRIPATGRFLTPGLVDTHFHLQSREDDSRLLRLLVANGVTSIFNLHGTPGILELRRRVAAREMQGPTIFTSGPYISDAPNWEPSAEEVERLVVEQKRAGYDFIKTHGDFSLEAFARLMAAARREGLKVIGHAPRNLGVGPMFEERMDAIAHAEEFLYAYFFFGAPDLSRADPEARRRFLLEAESRIPALASASKKAGVWVVPNLVAYRMIVEQGKDLASVLRRPETKYLPPQLAAEWQPGRNRYDRKYSPEMAEHMTWRLELLSKLTGALDREGVGMLAGSDAPIPGVLPGFSIHDELALLVAAGLSPYEALRTATANPAAFLERTGDFGTIQEGARADLLLLDADPLNDITNTTRLAGAVVRGQWVAASELKSMLEE